MRNQLKKNRALTKHAHNYSHIFDFNIKNVTILEFEPNLCKRLSLKMMHIQRENNTIDFRSYSKSQQHTQ